MICLTCGKFGWDWALLVSSCLLEESQHDRNIVDWAVISLNSINKQVRAAVIGIIALIFDSKTINIFANSFIKHPNSFIKNQLSVIQTGKEPVTKIC